MSVSYLDIGQGQPIIFLHGIGSGKEGFALQQNAVSGAGFRFISIDAPGFGETPLPDAPGLAPHVAAICHAMDELKLEKAILVGHSLGGMSAQELYALYPDRVSAMVLSATSPAFGKADGDFQKQFLQARLKPFDEGMTMAQFAQKFAPNLVGADASTDAIAEITKVMSGISVDSYRLAMHTLTTFDQRKNLPNISIPTLLISGSADKNAPAPMMEKMAGKIPNSKYVNLSGTGHVAPVENADGFNTHLIDFLNTLD